jgi:hypothetical protein
MHDCSRSGNYDLWLYQARLQEQPLCASKRWIQRNKTLCEHSLTLATQFRRVALLTQSAPRVSEGYTRDRQPCILVYMYLSRTAYMAIEAQTQSCCLLRAVYISCPRISMRTQAIFTIDRSPTRLNAPRVTIKLASSFGIHNGRRL